MIVAPLVENWLIARRSGRSPARNANGLFLYLHHADSLRPN
jgi:hypothetical protein